MRRSGSPARATPYAPAALALLVAGALAGSAALADLGFAVSVEEGATILGGPLGPRMAQPDQVTTASVDAITTATRVSSSGGVHLHLSRNGTGTLSLGIEHIHYRFDLDYEFGRAAVSIFGLRLLVAARLTVIQLRGAPLVTFGFGGYGELALYDEAVLSGSWVNLDVAPFGAGLMVDVHVHPWRFALPGDRGHLVPGLYARAYRGLISQLGDEIGSEAPLSNIALGLELRYEIPIATSAP